MVIRLAQLGQGAHRGSSPPRVRGRVVREPRAASTHPGQSSSHSGWNGSASTTASRSRVQVEQVVLERADLVVLIRVVVAVS
jgi:hypothetical protein